MASGRRSLRRRRRLLIQMAVGLGKVIQIVVVQVQLQSL